MKHRSWYKSFLPGWIVSSGGAAPVVPLTYFSFSAGASGASPGINQLWLTGFALPYSLTFAHIATTINTADASNLYDFGIYTAAGTLVADIGAQHLPATGDLTFATVQGSKTIAAGLYIFAWTGNSNAGQLLASGQIQAWVVNTNFGSSSGGQLPASIAAQSVAPARNALLFGLY